MIVGKGEVKTKTSVEISPKPPFAKVVAGERVTNMNEVHMPFTPIEPDGGLIGLDSAKGNKSSVSCADSSFAKGAFGAFCMRKSIAGILLKFRGGIKFFLMLILFSSTLFTTITSAKKQCQQLKGVIAPFTNEGVPRSGGGCFLPSALR